MRDHQILQNYRRKHMAAVMVEKKGECSLYCALSQNASHLRNIDIVGHAVRWGSKMVIVMGRGEIWGSDPSMAKRGYLIAKGGENFNIGLSFRRDALRYAGSRSSAECGEGELIPAKPFFFAI